jgi:hypothetical protein
MLFLCSLELLKDRLRDRCPNFVRVYSAAIETRDYPTPRGHLKYRRGAQDLSSEPALLVIIVIQCLTGNMCLNHKVALLDHDSFVETRSRAELSKQ